MTSNVFLELVGAAVLATSLPVSAQDTQWRLYSNGGYDVAVAYGGSHSEDTLVQLSCVPGAGGVPVVNAWIVARADGFSQGTRAEMEFYGPSWSVRMPVTVNGPGLYDSVSATISFGSADTVYAACSPTPAVSATGCRLI